MKYHARLAPSKAKVWLACPASVSRSESIAEGPTSDAARWGIVCHAILERSLIDCVDPLKARIDDLGGLTQYSEEEIEEMRRVALCAYDHATSQYLEWDPILDQVVQRAAVLPESPSYPGALTGRDDCWGTADITIIHRGGLEIVDLKTGKGVLCRPDDPQLKIYALGKLWEYRHRWLGYFAPDTVVPDIKVTLTVVQPRYPGAEPIRSVEMTSRDLFDWGRDVLTPGMNATDDPQAPAVPGKHCHDGFCPVRGNCPELAAQALSSARGVFEPVPVPVRDDSVVQRLTRDPASLSDEQLKFIVDHLDLISGWLSEVRKYATAHPPKGYKVVAGRSQRKWDAPDTRILADLSGIELKDGGAVSEEMLTVRKVVSPAQAEKRLKGKMDSHSWAKVSAHITKGEGAPTLVPVTDPRPALNDAASVFSPVNRED